MYRLPIDNTAGHKTNLYMDRWATEATMVSEMDIEPYLKQNREERKADMGVMRKHNHGYGRKVASIPTVVVEKLMKNGIWGDKKKFWKWLNEADQKVFRTTNEYLL